LDKKALIRCQKLLGYTFKDPALLVLAMTHSSVARSRLESNERLEFLGDAILGMVVCDDLYRRHPGQGEGAMTKIKSRVVSRDTCAAIAMAMGLCELVRLGKGMPAPEHLPVSVAAGLLEAVIGAIYMDGGIRPSRTFIHRHFRPGMDASSADGHQRNFKSMLQQTVQRMWNTTPVYELLDEKGPDHSKCFEIGVVVDGRRFPTAWGASKKQAEQEAARRALIALNALDEPDENDA
jgi:ribonuclease-3